MGFGFLKQWGSGCVAAFQFLSRLQVPIRINYTSSVFAASTAFYPVVGAIIGTIVAASGGLLGHIFPALPLSVMMVAVWIGCTGGLHLDGLMDTADGVLSHRDRQRMLEIMKDSRVGAMGVIVFSIVLLTKWAAISALLAVSWNMYASFLILVPLWSRWFMVIAIKRWPYARKEGGMGSFFTGVRKLHLVLATGLAVVLTLLILGLLSPLPFPRLLIYGAVIPAATLLAGWGIASYLAKKLGGLTGDTYGALNELLETLILLLLTALI
ncbi:adenosylcobinamide-GDP ribazoletransferase [Paenibacillus larvae]|uniref:adenosylcobinamide-GDP ribazoletransferase n=1 Tax=Paenibacillus larvae TaxID=1464 RepID=UPI0028540898|nr:adenosylcobinamide-GDP ribazoletransferase [Paenibacillus larvae]MDR5584307.1 adenosylcobinamide-GDP ribazoletransferase [Paenibacillus larvae]MDR5598522.1 adenosylcobinamide-GDP ribazoletransferase [Paenibacillus larvae]